jgi:predicted GIY-YIG superfamily endonuclease
VCAQRRCANKGDALRLQLAVKRLSRPEKETLLAGRRLAAFARRITAERNTAPE